MSVCEQQLLLLFAGILIEDLQRFTPCVLLRGGYFAQIQHRSLNRRAVGNSAVLDDAEVFVPLAVLFAFIASHKHADSLASEKLARNRIGLHHAGFETIWGIIEALTGKNILEIAIWPPNCESWVSPSSPVGSSFWFFSRKYTRYESTGSDLGDIIRVNAL